MWLKNWENTGLLQFDDKNQDGVISDNEINQAMNVLEQAKKQKEKQLMR